MMDYEHNDSPHSLKAQDKNNMALKQGEEENKTHRRCTQTQCGDFVKLDKDFENVIMEVLTESVHSYAVFLSDINDTTHLVHKENIERKATKKEIKEYRQLKMANKIAGN